MKKVTYNERYFIDKYTCIDKPVTRYFVSSWSNGGLTYFKANEFNVFCVDTDMIINIEV